jgi:hypothetical protein
MHDIDRTQLEMEWEADPFGAGEYEYDEYEYETYPEMFGEAEQYGGYGFEGPFDEAEEMELAAQLLEVTDEAELEQFLGSLFKKASRAVGRVIKSPVVPPLSGILKRVAKKALPVAGGAIGTYFGGPTGGAIGSRLASTAGRLFGLELEGMSVEDQEFEVARRYVRLAGQAAKNAAQAPPTALPATVAQNAVVAAAQQHAPGLLSGGRAMPVGGRGRSGRWVRRGHTIVLFGV